MEEEHKLLACPKYPEHDDWPDVHVWCDSHVLNHYLVNPVNFYPALSPVLFKTPKGYSQDMVLKVAKKQFRDRGLYEDDFYWIIVEGTFQI